MEFSEPTAENKQVVDITERLQNIVTESGLQEGVCHAFVQHTTTALTTADLDPGTDLDMLDAFYKMVPKLHYRHPHNPKHTPDHIIATLIGPNVAVPVKEGTLQLGNWQRVVLFEFDGPRERQITVNLVDAR